MPGGKVTMFFAILMFGEAGVEIAYPDPGFPIYGSVIAYSGAKPVPIPLREADGFAFSAESVLSRLTERTRLLILNSPANPTGGVTPPEQIDRLVAGLEAHPKVDRPVGRDLQPACCTTAEPTAACSAIPRSPTG